MYIGIPKLTILLVILILTTRVSNIIGRLTPSNNSIIGKIPKIVLIN